MSQQNDKNILVTSSNQNLSNEKDEFYEDFQQQDKQQDKKQYLFYQQEHHYYTDEDDSSEEELCYYPYHDKGWDKNFCRPKLARWKIEQLGPTTCSILCVKEPQFVCICKEVLTLKVKKRNKKGINEKVECDLCHKYIKLGQEYYSCTTKNLKKIKRYHGYFKWTEYRKNKKSTTKIHSGGYDVCNNCKQTTYNV